MKVLFFTYLAVLCSYLLLDFIWLGLVSQSSYQEAIGYLMRDTLPRWPWIAFYLMYSFVVVKIVIAPLVNQSSKHAFINGACLGLAAYGAYNLTNYAILKGWPIQITLIDWVWGTLVSAIISWVGFRVNAKLRNVG
ncbi:DUF2177 family protein [Alteromonas facilis]|uniref:DUF2177 family protein n=1 Tax=Alteromonas facilis TaxID=2048004 RepID=UPI000C28ED66|nr:DUF2177 family protein [Alteromonas facilis]